MEINDLGLTMGFSAIVGYTMGFAAKKSLKILMFVAGLFLTGLFGLAWVGLIQIDMDGLRNAFETLQAAAREGANAYLGWLVGQLPSAGSFTAAFVAAFKFH
ncbi:MAG: hypothetical protein KDI44_16370 [Thiothrix sp.]|nr:hypothetical protein [Thiothrix sp.]